MCACISASPGIRNFPAPSTRRASAGTRTISAFLFRVNGTGIATPKNTRELYVEDIGAA